MTSDEENLIEAPYGWMIDPATGQLRPKKRAGRPRVHQVADETDPAAHREAQLVRQRNQRERFYEAHPGYKADYDATWRKANPDKFSEYNKKSNLKLKRQVINAYGGKCACCGEIVLVFLTIDHVDGDGAGHRREMAAECNGNKYSQAGARTYRWLRDHNYPAGFQVLCMNCNCGKHWNGGVCPHEMQNARPDNRTDAC